MLFLIQALKEFRWSNYLARSLVQPVLMDNQCQIWNNFKNNYWPALYFIDRQAKKLKGINKNLAERVLNKWVLGGQWVIENERAD